MRHDQADDTDLNKELYKKKSAVSEICLSITISDFLYLGCDSLLFAARLLLLCLPYPASYILLDISDHLFLVLDLYRS